MIAYRTTEQDAHLREEYLQWARILSQGNALHGMLVVFVQKMCTAFHELAAAWQNGVVDEEALFFSRQRLSARTSTVLSTLVDNEVGTIGIAEDFRKLVESTRFARSMSRLAGLAEKAHALNHSVSDWLEGTA